MALPEMKKLDPRVKRTQNLILDAFDTLLETKGFRAMTVSDIAHAATVNRATFYAHFRDKQVLLEYNIARDIHKEIAQILPENGPLDEKSLRKLVVFMCHFVSGSNARCKDATQEHRPLVEREVRRHLSEVITKQLSGGKRGVPLQLTADVLTAALYAAASYWAAEEPEPPHLFADRVLPLLLPLLGAAVPAIFTGA